MREHRSILSVGRPALRQRSGGKEHIESSGLRLRSGGHVPRPGTTDTKLPGRALEKFHGILGHYHIQENKTDPGPALDWNRLIAEARRLE